MLSAESVMKANVVWVLVDVLVAGKWATKLGNVHTGRMEGKKCQKPLYKGLGPQKEVDTLSPMLEREAEEETWGTEERQVRLPVIHIDPLLRPGFMPSPGRMLQRLLKLSQVRLCFLAEKYVL